MHAKVLHATPYHARYSPRPMPTQNKQHTRRTCPLLNDLHHRHHNGLNPFFPPSQTQHTSPLQISLSQSTAPSVRYPSTRTTQPLASPPRHPPRHMEHSQDGDRPGRYDYLLSATGGRSIAQESYPVAPAAQPRAAEGSHSTGRTSSRAADQASDAASQDISGSGDTGGSGGDKPTRVMRNRAMARVSNAKRKGRIKEMESGLEKTRQKVQELQESIRSLEAENNDLRTLLQQ